MTTQKIATIALIVLIAVGVGVYAWWYAGPTGDIPWQSDYETALKTASAEDKLVLAYLHTDWCKFCKKLEAETFPSDNVRREASRFVWIKLNPESNEDGARLQQKYRVEGFPTILVLTGDGTRVDQIEGFLPPEQFVNAVNAVQEGARSLLSLKKKAANQPQSIEVQYDLGQKLLTSGDFAGASQAFQAVIKQDPASKQEKTLRAHYGLAIAFGSMGRYDEAIKYLDVVTVKSPDTELQADVTILKAHLLMSQGRNSESAELLKSYMQKYPNHDKVPVARRLLTRMTSGEKTEPDAPATAAPPLAKSH